MKANVEMVLSGLESRSAPSRMVWL